MIQQQRDKYPDMQDSRAAEQARQHGQPLILWREGRVVRVMPDELPNLPDQSLERAEQP
ncbi:MAG: hypothetical protein IT446_09890 [Phycisphaerales bacterium]|jgi:hypothetical protein|nr:hypothetical protein [Phycisphaerales bacterium]